jgi:hypothetical protein
VHPPDSRCSLGAGATHARLALITIVVVVAPLALVAQSFDVRAVADMLQLRGSSLGLIEGHVAEHLKDGRSVRADVEVTVLEKPRGGTVAHGQYSFILSYDLWEQRFAVTRTGTPPRSISHLTARSAEAWCLENMTVPLASLGRFAHDVPFWIRIDYRVQDRAPAESPGDDSTLGLRTLIDLLSRRKPDEMPVRSLEAGPFRVGN